MSAPVTALMNTLLFSEKYSDLKILSRNEGFHTHRNIVCAQCPFFEKVIQGPFSESQTGVVILDGDDPEAVSKMITFMYTGNYDDSPRSSDILARDRQVAIDTTLPAPTAPNNTETLQSTSCEKLGADGDSSSMVMPSDQRGIVNVRVYVLGEKYDLASLKTLAQEKFEAWAQVHWKDDGFAGLVRTIFEIVPEHDQALYEAASKIIVEKLEHLLVKPDFQQLFQDYGTLATAVMLQNRNDKIELLKELEKYKTQYSSIIRQFAGREISNSLAERINGLQTCYYCDKWFNLIVSTDGGQRVTLSCRNCEEECHD